MPPASLVSLKMRAEDISLMFRDGLCVEFPLGRKPSRIHCAVCEPASARGGRIGCRFPFRQHVRPNRTPVLALCVPAASPFAATTGSSVW